MKKREEWTCSEGCPVGPAPCPHLEALLPQMHDGDFPSRMSEKTSHSMTMNVFQDRFWSFDEKEFVNLMRNYGFVHEWDLELLTAKFYKNLSATDVAAQYNYLCPTTVKDRLRFLLKELKARGFEQEMQ